MILLKGNFKVNRWDYDCFYHKVQGSSSTFSSCKVVLIVNSMKGCKCIGIEIPKLAVTQNHLEELGKTDSTAESCEDDKPGMCVFNKLPRCSPLSPNWLESLLYCGTSWVKALQKFVMIYKDRYKTMKTIYCYLYIYWY